MKTKKIGSLLTAISMIASMAAYVPAMSASAAAAENMYGHVEAITDGAVIKTTKGSDGVYYTDVIYDDPAILNWHPKNTAPTVNRSVEGYWIGIDVWCPEVMVSLKDDGGRNDYVNSKNQDITDNVLNPSNRIKTFYKKSDNSGIKDGAKDYTGEDGETKVQGVMRSQLWGNTNMYNLYDALAAGKDYAVYKWRFNWDGDVDTGGTEKYPDPDDSTKEKEFKGIDQVVTIRIKPKGVKLATEGDGVTSGGKKHGDSAGTHLVTDDDANTPHVYSKSGICLICGKDEKATSASNLEAKSGNLNNDVRYRLVPNADKNAYKLIIQPEDIAKTYEIPAFQGTIGVGAANATETTETKKITENFIGEIARNSGLTAAQRDAITEVEFIGKLALLNDTAVDALNRLNLGAGMLKVDCRAEAEVKAVLKGVTSSEVASPYALRHDEYVANPEYKNHVCKYCSAVNTDYFGAHNFAKKDSVTNKDGAEINEKTGEHICACGTSSNEFLLTDAQAKLLETYKTKPTSGQNGAIDATVTAWEEAAAAKAEWNSIHTQGTATKDKHRCVVCNADLLYDHTKVMTSLNTTSHGVKCSECEKVLTTAENHTFKVTHSDVVSDKGVTDGVECSGCHNKHTSTQHSYTYAWTKVDETSDQAKDWELKYVGSANGVVCACGAVAKHEHEVIDDAVNHDHYCRCGNVFSGNHSFTKCYNENGKLVTADSGKAVVCSICGKVNTASDAHPDKTAHIDAKNADNKIESTFYDTAEHKHYCYCGMEIQGKNLESSHTGTLYDGNGKLNENIVVDTENNKHLCKKCGLDITKSVEHVADHVVIVPGLNPSGFYTMTKDAIILSKPEPAKTFKVNANNNKNTLANTDTTNLTGFNLYCACGALVEDSTPHTHDYSLGVNSEDHYCRCGRKQATPVHDTTNTTPCSICGQVKSHDHVFSTRTCTCTVEGCNVTNHVYSVVGTGENKFHRCQRCGKEVGHETVADAISDAHVYKVDGNKHVCDCGFENPDTINSDHGHIYGTRGAAVHECQVEGCEYDKHDNKGACVNQIHTCSCGYKHSADTGHTYNSKTDICEAPDCGKLNPNHKHAVSGFGRYADLCRCGEEIDHVLAPENNQEHICSNVEQTVIVSESDKKQTVKKVEGGAKCTLGTDKHYFGRNNTEDFCECGYVNPALLANVVPAKNSLNGADGKQAKTSIEKLLSTGYSTAYISSLQSAANRLYYYNFELLNGLDNKTKADIKTVNTSSEQAEFETNLNAYMALYENLDKNQAAGGAYVYAIVTKDKNNEDLPTGITLENSPNGEYGTVNGQFGNKVDLSKAISIDPGYKFVGWYTDAEGKKPASSDNSYLKANFEVTVGNGYQVFYAKAEPKTETAIVELPGNITYVGTITGRGELKNNGAGRAFVIGEKVTLTLCKDDNVGTTRFLNLTDSQGATHEIDTVKGYTFTVTGSEKFTYVTYKADTGRDTIYVRFMSDDSETARVYAYGDAEYVSKTNKTFNLKKLLDDAKVSNPTKAGYKFDGWESTDYVYSVKDLEKAVVADETVHNIKLYPVFVAEKYTINLVGGKFISATHESLNKGEGFETDTVVGLTADAMKNGKYFSGWYVNGVKVSETRTYYYAVNSSGAKVEAKFEGTEPIVEKTKITATASRILADSAAPTGKQIVTLVSNREVASGNKVVEVGFIYSSKGAVNADTLIDNVNGSTIKKAYKAVDTRLGSYQIDIGLSSNPTATVTARAYVIYTDANGEQQTAYSEGIVTCTSADLAK